MAKKIDARDAQPKRVGKRLDPQNPMSPGKTMRRTKTAQAVDTSLASSFKDFDNASSYPDAGVIRTSVSPDASARERHTIRKGWFLAEAYRQSANRQRMAKCESYYDSEQWTYDDAQTVRDRGQDPIVYNEVKPTIDWLMGTERRTRVDFVVMAEDDDPTADDDAAAKTKILKYLDNTNLAQFERSWAAEDAFKAGIGWLEVSVRGDKTGAPVYVGAESWRHILWDSQAQRRDLQDARYLFRIKVVDFDMAVALFPDKRVELERCVQTGDTLQVFSEWMGGLGAVLTGLDQLNTVVDPIDYMTSKPVDMFNTRKRILLLECWAKMPVPRKPDENGLNGPPEYRIQVSIMTEHDTLIEAWSPYKHNRFPFIPVWAYRNRRTGLPYSPIWPLIGPQDALNKRMSKSVFEANANQYEIEKGAVDAEAMDIGEIRDELNDPNGIAVWNDGALAGNRVRKIDRGANVAQQLELANADRMTIRAMSGVTGDNRGENTNVVSGKAVLAKQDQGSLLTAELFDNLLLSRKLEGDITLSMIEQYMSEPAAIRVADGIGRGEVVRINQPSHVDEQGQHVPNPDTGLYEFTNDITARQAHFVVGEQAWKQAYAEAAFDSLMEVLSQLSASAPQAVINLLDLVFDMHPNLPKKRQIVQRLRAINGQNDPDEKPTPEQQAQREQQAAIAQQQFELQMAQLRAQVAESQAKGEKLNADAVLQRLTGIYEAAQAAQILATLPTIAPIADELLRSAGMQDASPEPGQVIQQPTMQPLQGVGGQPQPTPGAAPGAMPTQPVPPHPQTDGAAVGHLAGHLQGVHTPAADGIK